MRAAANETSRPYQIKKTEEHCHRFIRERDLQENGCISCGITTGQWTAGHFFSVGHAPEIRWHPDNIHGQCGQCNTHKSGNTAEYAIRLEKKIGRARLENLALCRTPQNLTIEDLKEIQQWYKDQYQWLIAQRNPYSIA